MFWKVGLGLGILGFVVGAIILVVSLLTLTSSTDELAQDFALGFFLFSIALTIGAIVLAIVSLIFVMRASKKDFDANNPK